MALLSILATSIFAAFFASGAHISAGSALFSSPRHSLVGIVEVQGGMLSIVKLPGSLINVAAEDAAPGPKANSDKRASISAECALLISQLTIGVARDSASADLLDTVVRASSSMFPDDHAIAQNLVDLSALRGRSVLSHVALRERFYTLGPAAVREAMYNSTNAWAPLVSFKARIFVVLGISAPPEETVSEIAVRNAIGLVDRGQLRDALFELTASAPEVQKYLSVWIAEARLRLAYDAAIGVLLKHVIRRCNEAAVN
jgi:hypothetical protein